MNKLLITLISCALLVTPCFAEPPLKIVKKVLISKVVDHPALNTTVSGIIAGLADHGFKQNENLEVRIESAQANAVLAAQIANKFVMQLPDIVVGVGTLSAQSFLKYTTAQQVKLVFSSVTDPTSAGLIHTAHVSGVSNFVPLAPQLKLFKELLPQLTSLGVIYNPGEINSLSIVKQLNALCRQFGITLVTQTATKTADVAQSAVKLAGMVDALFISNDNTALSSLQSIIATANQRGIPVFVSDTDAVKSGALAALGPNQYAVGYQTGCLLAKVLAGQELVTLPIEYPEKNQLFINLNVAHSLEISVSPAILAQATTIIQDKV